MEIRAVTCRPINWTRTITEFIKAKGGTLSNYQDKTFQPLTDEQIKRHLLGEQLIGIYPLLLNNASISQLQTLMETIG
jgi:hypothetical protein